MLCVCLTFFTEGGHFTLAPAIYKKLFGDEGARVFGWGFSFIGLASIVNIFTIKPFLDDIGFNGFLRIFEAYNIFASLILILIFKEEPVEVETIQAKRVKLVQ